MNAVVSDVEFVPVSGEASRPSAGTPPGESFTVERRKLSSGKVVRLNRTRAYREPTVRPTEHDGRGRPKDDSMVEVDAALEAWARWARSALVGIGWPPMTLLARVIEFGVSGAASRGGGAAPESDSLCEIVERAVLRLKDIERTVLVRHYLNWQPVEVSARYSHMSPGRFRTLLHRARKSVGDYLEGAKFALQQNTP